MAVTYHLRPGMAFITKTQTSTVSSFSEVDALKQNQTQEISGEKKNRIPAIPQMPETENTNVLHTIYLPKRM